MNVEAKVTVNVHLANTDEVRSIKLQISQVTRLLQKVAEAVIKDPAALREMSDLLGQKADELQAAVESVQK